MALLLGSSPRKLPHSCPFVVWVPASSSPAPRITYQWMPQACAPHSPQPLLSPGTLPRATTQHSASYPPPTLPPPGSFVSHLVCPKLSCPFQPLPFPGSLLVGPSQIERLPPAGTLGAPMPLSFVSSCSAPFPPLFPLVLSPSKCRPPCCVPRLSAACLPPSFPSSSAAPRAVLPLCTPDLSHPWLTSSVAPQPSARCLGTTGRL